MFRAWAGVLQRRERAPWRLVRCAAELSRLSLRVQHTWKCADRIASPVDAIVAGKHGKEGRKSFMFELYVFLSVFL